MTRGTVLVVGAGFAGAVHARELAEAGFAVRVIDRRPHIAGNAFDEVTPEGIRCHRYGPHLFHTNNERVVSWVSRFGEFVPYEHRVVARLQDGRMVPLPINRRTIEAVFGVALGDEDDTSRFLASVAEPIAAPANAREHLHAHIGQRLTDIFFAPYTRKMWGLDLAALSADVVKRIPLRLDDDDRYFPNDAFQVLPRHGYTRLFETILDHPAITVSLETFFEHSMLKDFVHCFNSMAIDEFFGECHGPLLYRSIRFHHRVVRRNEHTQPAATVNFTDEGPFTRETDWSCLPGHVVHDGADKIITREEPCSYEENDRERYYPIKDSGGRQEALLQRYRGLAAEIANMTFIGRCGTYQYLDMHQVINQSLAGVRAWIKAQP